MPTEHSFILYKTVPDDKKYQNNNNNNNKNQFVIRSDGVGEKKV